jgi:STE24 endopeptidase
VREAKRVGLSALLSLILLEGFYAILRFGGACWPLWATAGWAAVSVVLARLLPTVLIPIFYPLQPIHDAGLTQRLLHLAEAVRVPVLGVFRVGLGIETKKANAALVGLGRTRRILLSDTLLARFSHDEIEGVLAHELAHHCYRHMAKGLALSVVSTLVALWLTAALAPYALTALGLPHLSALAGFPLLMVWFVLLQLLGMPIRNGISRLFEWQADRFALARTSPAVFAAALERLAQQNLADPCPPRWVEIWLHDHPAMHKRIAAARAYSDLKGQ